MRKNKILLTIVLMPLIIYALYTAAWFIMKGEVERQVYIFRGNMEAEGITVTGDMPVSGFPGPYTINFSGTLSYQGQSTKLQDFTLKSFFLPYTPLSISIPHGVALSGGNKIDYLTLAFIIPPSYPGEASLKEMQSWKNRDGQIEITNYEIRKESLIIKGSGVLSLDEELQPKGRFPARITGAIEFTKWLESQKRIEKKEAKITKIVLAGLTETDPETGENVINTTISLQNQMLFLGPLRLLRFPPVAWLQEDRPAPLQ